MKTFIKITSVIIVLTLTVNSFAQSVGINSMGAAPDKSALLDLSATGKGFLITRVDTTDINSPAFGLMTLAPSDSCLYLYNGIHWRGMGGGGNDCSCNCSNETPTIPTCEPDNVTQVKDVVSLTGKVWMDRNLGASKAATSRTDAPSYGDLYQWGRCSDGHQKRSSNTTTTLSSSDTPGHDDFILAPANPFDWRSPQNDNLWQGVNGVNNPCPSGYRVPTGAEWNEEMLSWSSQDADGAIASPLKVSLPGFRNFNSGNILNVGTKGNYWSSTTVNLYGQATLISSTQPATSFGNSARIYGYSIRCIKG